ncbi:MAG TPA: sigma-70 family RNA polymerase sigma factor [Polyangiaceae bacterium]
MDEKDWLAQRFEQHRTHLRAVAYRMLGSLPEADEAVQDAWLRLSRAGGEGVENLGGWLTTVVARVCLNVLQARKARPEEPTGLRMPDPVVSREGQSDPEQEALLADSIGLALLVVLERLDPAERLAFVLHDMFDLPFEEIAPMVGRSPTAARQLASRARRRVQGGAVPPIERDLARQREVVEAFFAAGRAGDFEALVRVLHPDVVLRSDLPKVGEQRGAARVARMALGGARAGRTATVVPVLVNGAAGALIIENGQLVTIMGFTVFDGKIVEIDGITDPERLRRIDVLRVCGTLGG